MPVRRRSVRLAAAVSSILAAPALAVGAGLVASLAYAPGALAQETSTAISGFVVDEAGKPLSGARVTIEHMPSGTTATTTSSASGQFSATGLRIGGPYRVTAAAEGRQMAVVDDIYTTLGQRASLTVVTQPIVQLAGVEVLGSSERDASIGAGAQFNANDVRQLPSISRDIKDVVRIDPRVFTDKNNFDALEIAGVNNRYNSITVDGVRQSDDFGLNNSGYPTQRSPISMDAIQAVSIQTAPFSVEYSHFRGSTINVVTKSGTNEFTGSAFYYDTSDSLVGDETKGRKLKFTFDEKTYGATFGGPIFKDKLFFFLSYEKLERESPQDFGPVGSGFPVEIPGISLADYNQVVSLANSVYQFDPGSSLSVVPEDDEKILAKLDWNITDNHRASLAYQHTEGNQLSTTNMSTSFRTISTPSGLYNRAITMDSYSLQLFSDWNDWFSTEVKLARKEIETRQDSLKGTDFAEMRVITSGGGTVFVGPDEFRHANFLTNDLDTFKLKGNFFLGDHTLTAGYEKEKLDIFNLFVPTSRGQYFFSSIANFQNRQATRLVYNNAFSNNADDGAAAFGYDVDSFYFQDEWQVSPALKVQAGVRMDRWSSGDDPLLNANFQTRYGYPNTLSLDGRDLMMPRFGFSWQVRPETTVRGGWGLFGGGTPNVWISNSYSNNGVTVVRQDINAASPFAAALSNIDGRNINAAVLANHTTLRGDGPVNAVDPNFEIPSQYRWNLGVDHTLPWDVQLTADVIVSRVKDEVLWKDLRLVQTATAPDGRPRYSTRADAIAPFAQRSSSTQDFLLTNTTQGEGTVFSIDLSKTFRTAAGRIDTYFGYGHQDVKDTNSGTSSTASSNWDNLAIADPNNPALARSNYEIEHMFKGAVTWRKAFFGDYETSIAMVGERRSGRPYSYTFGAGTTTIFGDPRQGSRQRQLFYVPLNQTDVLLQATGPNALTWAQLDAYIQQQGLEKYRGKIMPRNSHNSPWTTLLDLRFSQEIPAWRKLRGVVTVDVENFANLINSDWGQVRSVGFPYVAPVVDASLDATTGKYIYRTRSGQTAPTVPFQSLNASASVWQVQLGIRLEF